MSHLLTENLSCRPSLFTACSIHANVLRKLKTLLIMSSIQMLMMKLTKHDVIMASDSALTDMFEIMFFFVS